jgi:hypothetical protein
VTARRRSRTRARKRAAGAYTCPHCFEPVDTYPDPGGGLQQEYIEDCPLCCRPNRIVAAFSEEDDGFLVVAHPDL